MVEGSPGGPGATDAGGGPAGGPSAMSGTGPPAAPATTELGIDIIKVERIRRTLERYGARFAARVLTPDERRYVRDRPETFAGRWAAKEAVSKVLGLGVRGIGWRDIEIERLPTGQPAVRLHGRAAQRAAQLGMGPIAVSISHESDYAVAIAHGLRTAGGAFVFPLDIDARLDERERTILARMDRLRRMASGDGPAAEDPRESAETAGGDARPSGGIEGAAEAAERAAEAAGGAGGA